MSITKDIRRDIRRDVKEARKIRLRLPWWAVLSVVIGLLPVFWLFDHFQEFGIALPTLVSIWVMGFVIKLKWQLRRHVWFWGTLLVLAAFHVPLILLVPWTTNWVPAVATALIASADFIVMISLLDIVAKLMHGSNAAEK